MVNRMSRLLARFLVTITMASSIVAVASAPASAFGGETFGCRISPGTVFTWHQVCTNSKYTTGEYWVAFQISNLSGSYTFSWSVGPYQRLVSGCTSSSTTCTVAVPGRQSTEVYGTVHYSQGSQSGSLWSYAYIDSSSVSPPGCPTCPIP